AVGRLQLHPDGAVQRCHDERAVAAAGGFRNPVVPPAAGCRPGARPSGRGQVTTLTDPSTPGRDPSRSGGAGLPSRGARLASDGTPIRSSRVKVSSVAKVTAAYLIRGPGLPLLGRRRCGTIPYAARTSAQLAASQGLTRSAITRR